MLKPRRDLTEIALGKIIAEFDGKNLIIPSEEGAYRSRTGGTLVAIRRLHSRYDLLCRERRTNEAPDDAWTAVNELHIGSGKRLQEVNCSATGLSQSLSIGIAHRYVHEVSAQFALFRHQFLSIGCTQLPMVRRVGAAVMAVFDPLPAQGEAA